MDEGIESLDGLKSLYTSSEELHAELAKVDVPQPHRDMALTAWRVASRALATAKRQSTPSSSNQTPRPTVPDQRFPVKLRREPMIINAPGLWYLRWQRNECEKAEKATRAQGLQPTCTEHMEQV